MMLNSKRNSKLEENAIIAINAIKKIISIFLGPFLTAYFIQTSIDSMSDLSIYSIFSYTCLALFSLGVSSIIKRRFQIGMFRVGILTAFIYVATILVLQEQIIDHLFLLAILHGISASTYWMPYNLFVGTKISNTNRTRYTVKNKLVSSFVAILCPLFLGFMITTTNYILTGIIILAMSLIQFLLSFIITQTDNTQSKKFELQQMGKIILHDKHIKQVLMSEFLVGFNKSDGALEVLMTIIVYESVQTDLNLGIITATSSLLSIIFIYLYGKVYSHKKDNHIILLSGVTPFFSLALYLIFHNSLTAILLSITYNILGSLLILTTDIRLYNTTNSAKLKQHNLQNEFLAIRECVLNSGRIVSFLLLLIAGLSQNQLVINSVLIILVLSILLAGLIAKNTTSNPDQIQNQLSDT